MTVGQEFPTLKTISGLMHAWAREHAQMQVSFERSLAKSLDNSKKSTKETI